MDGTGCGANAVSLDDKEYRQIFDGAIEGIYAISPEGKNLLANPALARMLGYDSPTELLNSISDSARQLWLNPEERPQFLKLIDERGLVEGYETQFRTRQGSLLWVSLSSRRVCGPDGKLLHYSGFVRDITSQRLAEQALLESEARFRTLIEHAPVAIALSRDGFGLYANQKFAEIHAIQRREEFFGLPILSFFAENYEEELRERTQRQGQRLPVPEFFETVGVRMDGSRFPAHVAVEQIQISDGPAQAIFVEDITLKKRGIAKRLQSEALLNETGRISRVGGWILDPATNALTWTREVYRIHEVEEDFVPTLEKAIEFYTPECRPRIARAVERAIECGEPFDLELEIVTAKGKRVWVHAIGAMREGAEGTRILGGAFQDITARRQAEKAVRESEAKFAAVFKSSPSMIALLAVDGTSHRIVEVNSAFESITGYTSEECVGLACSEVGMCADPERIADAEKEFWAGGQLRNFEYRIRRKTGEFRDGLLSMEPVTVDGNQYAIALTTDVTEHKLSLERVRERENRLRALSARMETIREQERTEIAREVHDELGSMLTCMKMNLRWLEERFEEFGGDRRFNEITDKLVATTDMVDATIRTVQRIAAGLRPGALDKLGLSAALQVEAEKFQNSTGILCKVEMHGDPRCLPGDVATAAFRITKEALTNVARHARATTVEIELWQDDWNCSLEIRDNGVGMCRDIEHRPDSFGLMGMRERSHQLGGKAWFIDQSGGGTVVRIQIPIGSGEETRASEAIAAR
jgi:PAS domain S-box-containing protein